SAATDRLTRTGHLSRTQTKEEPHGRVAACRDCRTTLCARHDGDACFVGGVCSLCGGDVAADFVASHDSHRRRLCFATRAREPRVLTAETQYSLLRQVGPID